MNRLISQMFVQRGFWGLLALSWGFMLGGALLMTALTYGLAAAGCSRWNVTCFQGLILALILPVFWVTAEREYRQRNITTFNGFFKAFWFSVYFGAALPALYAVGGFALWREGRQQKRSVTTPSRFQAEPCRTGIIGFIQNLTGPTFCKPAR